MTFLAISAGWRCSLRPCAHTAKLFGVCGHSINNCGRCAKRTRQLPTTVTRGGKLSHQAEWLSRSFSLTPIFDYGCDKKLTLEQVSDSQVLIRSRILRENGKYIPKQSFLMRKFYFNNQEDGFFKKTKRKVVPPSPMTDPSMLTDMMKGNVTNVLPMILIGGWINWTFSGFVTTKVPFPLTLRFKPMLQQGIELLSLDASWVSSASWYFLNVFGLRSMYSLILGQDNGADQSRIMQEQMSGAAMAMPADTNKAFKAEWEALELTDHQWALESVEEELMSRELDFDGMFSKELPSGIF
ncbi:hypothetical protein LDENG_00298000 [Lucifuga dentata]|nr:hypothetical protein LDENG_00298000 [Lucifuga dentata]